MPPKCARDYQIQIYDGSAWKTVADVKGNYQRRRIHLFPQIEGSKVKVVVTETNGDPSARIYEIRVYHE